MCCSHLSVLAVHFHAMCKMLPAKEHCLNGVQRKNNIDVQPGKSQESSLRAHKTNKSSWMISSLAQPAIVSIPFKIFYLEQKNSINQIFLRKK